MAPILTGGGHGVDYPGGHGLGHAGSPGLDRVSTPVGEQLRAWRVRRRLSQLDLAIQADVSTRHLSFVETGRSKPTSQMILRLSEQLDVPLRDRNELLLAGGYAGQRPTRPAGSTGPS
jgi:DNA-binding XRE family transcriptional regulator